MSKSKERNFKYLNWMKQHIKICMGAVQAVLSGIFIIYNAKSLYYKKEMSSINNLSFYLKKQ